MDISWYHIFDPTTGEWLEHPDTGCFSEYGNAVQILDFEAAKARAESLKMQRRSLIILADCGEI